MFHVKSMCMGALAAVAACIGMPERADAAAYFSEATWYGALSDAADARGAVILSPLGDYTVAYADWYGSWDQNTKAAPFTPGPEIGPYVAPGSTLSRTGVYFAKEATPGQFAAAYSCLNNYNACVGVMSMTFTLPFDVIGFSGQLDLWADYWPSFGSQPMRELEVGDIWDGTDWKINRPDTFYGKMFDLPTNTFTVSWGVGGFGSDNFAGFTLSDVTLVRAPTAVPEPASIAMFGFGLLGLFAARRSVRPSRQGRPQGSRA